METIELKIRELIIHRYGSLKKFCEIIDMPWTTLDSILKRGIANSNITNVLKITRELKIDTERLANGIISHYDAEELIIDYFDNDNSRTLQRIYAYYKLLNNLGKQKATEQIEMLTKIPDYTKQEEVYLNAANAIEDANEEDKKHDEDIMDDDNF